MIFLARLLFRDIGKNVGKGEVVFRVGISTLSILFAASHVLLLILSAALGEGALIAVSAVCIVGYVLIVVMNHNTINRSSGVLFVLLPCFYALVGVLLAGWGIGAQWYLIALIVPIFIVFEPYAPTTRRMYAFLLVAVMAVCYAIEAGAQLNYSFSLLQGVNIALSMIVGLTSVEILLYSASFNQRRYQKKIENLADEENTDPLTKIHSRRYIENMLTNLFWEELSKRERTFIAKIDVDFFKHINDTFGNEVGDEVLKKFAQLLQKGFRGTDATARWEGDAFLVILNDLEERGAIKALENFRGKLQNAEFKVQGENINIQVTMGYVGCAASDNYTDCIKYCEEALYYGKNNGRNRIVNYRDVPGAKDF